MKYPASPRRTASISRALLLGTIRYMGVAEKRWAEIVSHISAKGRLGSIQPIDRQPGKFEFSASYVGGVGASLLPASEMDATAKN